MHENISTCGEKKVSIQRCILEQWLNVCLYLSCLIVSAPAVKHDAAQQTGVRLKEQEGYNYTSFT